jgi:hypothetical protein
LSCFGGVELLPDPVECLFSLGVEGLSEEGDEGEPIDGALVQEGLLEHLPLELLEEDAVLVECLLRVSSTFSKLAGETHPLWSGSYLARLW